MSARSQLTLALTLLITATAHAADLQGKKAFVTAWEGRAVVLTRPLYSVAFNERSRFLPVLKRDGKVTGLTVVTPTELFYRFDARREDETDIVDRDPMKVVAALQNHYRRSTHLDTSNVQDIEAATLERYDPGVALIVTRVKVEDDCVRLSLRGERDDDLVTSLTVQWPTPFSRNLAEAPAIDDLLNRFIRRK